MIGYLRGKIIEKDLRYIILDVSGVGYKVYTNYIDEILNKNDKEVSFFTYLSVKENALDLYGFRTKDELTFFELLLGVSGIGPKSAMSILGVSSIPLLLNAIKTDNPSLLTKTSGIGKKNAEKIVLELKNKIDNLNMVEQNFVYEEDDSLDALIALGYSEKQAREALKKALGSNPEEKIKSALKYLSK